MEKRPTNELMQELLSEVTDISGSVATETESGREIVESLNSLSSNISDSLDSLRYLQEEQQIEQLKTFTDLKDTIVERMSYLGEILKHEFWKTQKELEKIPKAQMDAAIVGAHLTARWINNANDPTQRAGESWATMFIFLAHAQLLNKSYSLDEIKDEMILKGISADFASAMLNKLAREKIIILDDSKYILDVKHEKFLKAKSI
jgi:hypothetical protein